MECKCCYFWCAVSKGILITEKDILIPGKVPIDWLDDNIITMEAKYSINITKSRKKFVESTLQCGQQIFVLWWCEIYQFKSIDSEMGPYSLLLWNILNCFTVDTM